MSGSQPYYGPDEPQETIDLERNFIAGDLIVGIGFGIQLLMFSSVGLYLWRRREQRKSIYLLAYITLMLVIETIFVAVQARTVQIVYIDNRNYPGGPWKYFLDTQNLPVNVMYYATLFILTFLSDQLVLWRCYVIWTASSGKRMAYIVTFFPAISLLASFVMGTLWTLQSSQPGLSFYSALPLAYGTSYYAISLGVNILLTFLIVTRLLFYRKRVMATLPADHAKHYLSLAAIVIESASLYSTFALVFLITYAVSNPTNQVWFGVSSASQQIANYLIIYRIADGTAWSKETVSPTLPTIAFKKNAPVDISEMTNRTNISSFHAASANTDTSHGSPSNKDTSVKALNLDQTTPTTLTRVSQ